jgi:hypothetical protein
MIRKVLLTLATLVVAPTAIAADTGDVVLDWNWTLHDLMQSNGVVNSADANPGWSTRSIAMMNTAIYDAMQSLHRTHTPFLYAQKHDPATIDQDAAVHAAAFRVLSKCYPGGAPDLEQAYLARINAIPESPAKAAGIALGQEIGQGCVDDRTIPYDGSDRTKWAEYVAHDGAGYWRPQPGQSAWGPEWGGVRPFGIPVATLKSFVDEMNPIPALSSPEYAAAFHEVKTFGALTNSSRTATMTDTGLFWAYDRPGMGPPPVLYLRNLMEIAAQIGTTEADNAVLFAQASVAQANASIAAWDAKFRDNFWRPIGAIQGDRLDGTKGHDDGIAATVEDPAWRPLGAPQANPQSSTDDFTPPFPAWPSGHATMGAAVFRTLKAYFGNDFAAADLAYGELGDAPTNKFTLTSREWDGLGALGMQRNYAQFTEDISNWGLGREGLEYTPEGENAMSRIYLGLHWIFDQKDGTLLGERIANFVASNLFRPVPEPAAAALAGLAAVLLSRRRRRRTEGAA